MVTVDGEVDRASASSYVAYVGAVILDPNDVTDREAAWYT